MSAKKDDGPQAVQHSLNNKYAESFFYPWGMKSFCLNKKQVNTHRRVKNYPHRSENPIGRVKAGLLINAYHSGIAGRKHSPLSKSNYK